jgi:hypothetical protein
MPPHRKSLDWPTEDAPATKCKMAKTQISKALKPV